MLPDRYALAGKVVAIIGVVILLTISVIYQLKGDD